MSTNTEPDELSPHSFTSSPPPWSYHDPSAPSSTDCFITCLSNRERERIQIFYQSFHTQAFVCENLGSIHVSSGTENDNNTNWKDTNHQERHFGTCPLEKWTKSIYGAIVFQIYQKTFETHESLKACLLCVNPDNAFPKFKLSLFGEKVLCRDDHLLIHLSEEARICEENQSQLQLSGLGVVIAVHIPSSNGLRELYKQFVNYLERYTISQSRDPQEWWARQQQHKKEKQAKPPIRKTSISCPNTFRQLTHLNPWK